MLRTATYNIAFGTPDLIDPLTNVMRACNADVITLNEADHRDVVAELAQRLEMQFVWARGSGDRHVATLSRYPILKWQIHTRKPLTQAALVTTLDYPVNGQPLTIYNIHLRPDPYWIFELFRYLAVNRLLALIGESETTPHLIMGDFNTYAVGDTVDVSTILRHMRGRDRKILQAQRYRFLRLSHRRLMRAGYTDCFRQRNPHENGYTFMRHRLPVSRMDYVLACPMMRQRLGMCAVHDRHPDRLVASDHLPLVAEFY